MTSQSVFSAEGPLGLFSLRDLDPHKGAKLIQSWVSRAYAKSWLMQNYDIEDVRNFYLDFNNKEANQAYLGFYNDIEVYDPENAQIAEHYDTQAGDVGWHFFAAPSYKTMTERLAAFTRDQYEIFIDL